MTTYDPEKDEYTIPKVFTTTSGTATYVQVNHEPEKSPEEILEEITAQLGNLLQDLLTPDCGCSDPSDEQIDDAAARVVSLIFDERPYLLRDTDAVQRDMEFLRRENSRLRAYREQAMHDTKLEAFKQREYGVPLKGYRYSISTSSKEPRKDIIG